MRQLRRSESRLISVTLCVALGIGIYAWLIEPRVARALDLHGQMTTVNRQLAESRMLLEHKDEIRAQADMLQKQLTKSEGDDTEYAELLAEVENLARRQSLTAVSLRPEKAKEMGLYRLVGVKLSIEGSERDLARFLFALGDSQQLLRVDEFQLDSLRKGGQLRADLLIVKVVNQRGH